jgi:hypothetical protein
MPTMPKSIEGVVAISDDKKIKPLGYLTWFSVPDESVGLRALKLALAKAGLPPTLAPKDTKAINTFKRAMREQEGRKRVGDVIHETDVVQISESADDCVYQISTVVRDLDERVVDYPKAMRVIFMKNDDTDPIKYNALGGVSRPEVLGMMESIQDFYDKNTSKITGARVRGVVRNYIRSEADETRKVEGLSGENLRGKAGGIYFIPERHAEQVEALSEMLHDLYKGRAYLHAVPLADSASERELVRRHHMANAREEIKEAMQEVRKLRTEQRERAVRSDVIANHWSRFRALQRRAGEYASILGDEQEEINDMARMLQEQLKKLT